jgi:anaerobic magnesium-protoporphyrin IX monomethyl ester cyclase
MDKKGKVLFIVHDVYQNDNEFPLGIGYLAAVLKKHGVEVEVACQDIFHWSNEELADLYLKNNSYDLIGFGFLSARFRETVLGLCGTVNKYKKDAWLVLGGHGTTPIADYVLEKTQADIATLGEAEETIVELFDCKVNGGDLSKVKGIAYRTNEGVFINNRRKPVVNLDSIPFPEWSLFPMERYINSLEGFGSGKNRRRIAMLSSRGCINRCNFCYRMEDGIRFRSVDNVIEEIKTLGDRYGVTYFTFFDELFCFPKKKTINFCERVKKENLDIQFDCNARVDIFDRETAAALKEAGCVFLNFGFESSDQKVLDLMKKNTTVEENIAAAEIARDAGIGMGLNFLWGNKGDTKDSLQSNIKLIKRFNQYDQLRTMHPPIPFPGSELYCESIERGLLGGPEDFFNKFKNSDLLTVNFTDLPDEEFYKLLFDANKELILDHYTHIKGDMNEANRMIESFYDLYFRGKTKFRGARHYEKKQ